MESAESLLKRARTRASKKPGFFSSMMQAAEVRFEDAFDLSQQAANAFKLEKNWRGAADAYMFSAEMQEQLKAKHEQAACYIEAGKMLKKCDVKKAIGPFSEAASLFASGSKFTTAAKYMMEVGEIQENDGGDLEGALASYERALDFSQMDGSESGTNKANLKVATIAASLEKYDRAIELFEQTARVMAESSLLKFSCKEPFLKAGLCLLCTGDATEAKIKHERYEEQAAIFRDSRESLLLKALIEAVENEDQGAFTQVVQEYDAVSKLDGWMTQVLLRIKKSISGEDLL